MLRLQANTWAIAALRTVETPAGNPIVTLIVTRTATLTVILTATRTAMVILAVEAIHRPIVTGTATHTDETAETGETGGARPRQEAAGVGTVPLRALDAGVAIVEAHLAAVAAVRRNRDRVHPTMVVMALFRLLRRMPMEGGEPLKRQKIRACLVFLCNRRNVKTTLR